MVTTCGDIIKEAYRLAAKLGGDDELLPSEYNTALIKLQNVILSAPGMGHWIEVEADGDYTAGENERVRVITDDAVTITVPTSVVSSQRLLWCCNQVTLVCEGYADRAPKDGAKVHVSDAFGDDAATYFYRADIAQWTAARDLTRDSEVPFSADMDRYLAAMLADDLTPDLHPKHAMTAEEGRRRFRARYGKRQQVAVDTPLIYTSSNREYLR